MVDLITDLSRHWGFAKVDEAYQVTGNIPFHEAGLLKLNCDKALFHLGWEPTLDFGETVDFIAQWYTRYYRGGNDMVAYTCEQLSRYRERAQAQGRLWTAA